MSDDTTTTAPSTRRRWLGARVGAIFGLAGAVAGVGYVGQGVYHVATDGFVAPIVLSPESDMVIQSKLSMSQLVAERIRLETRKDEIEAEVEAADQAIEKLSKLQEASTKALDWTNDITTRQARGGARELHALAEQRGVLAAMLTRQDAYVAQVKKDLEAGLVSRTEYVREAQTLSQLRVAAIENERANIVGEVQLGQIALTQRALKGEGANRIWSPEMLLQQDQLVRVQCDLLKLEAERRAKTAERHHIAAELEKLDGLVAQLKLRPVFRATEANTNVAFVPYTQIDSVKQGADVYDCFWGIAACKRVGRVAEVLPGEVIVPDPWGTPARGQYAIMDLANQRAAESRTLRVRPRSSPLHFIPSMSSAVAAK